MKKLKIDYRTWYKGIPPKPTKLQIPGWAGEDHNHGNGAKAQPWHCQPFVTGATYGLELIYPFETEAKISVEDDKLKIEGDFSQEEKECDIKLPPFMSFSDGHYGFTSSLDISTDMENVLRIEPHPRYYTDNTGSVPLAIVGHIEPWWSRIFFIVFKKPFPGQTHIFRKGEPYAQVLVVPRKISYEINEMSQETKNKRSSREAQIVKLGKQISKNVWRTPDGSQFDDKYKILSKAYYSDGDAGIENVINEANESRNIKKKIPIKLIKAKK